MSSRFKELFEEANQKQPPVKNNVKKSVQIKPEETVAAVKSTKLKGKRNNPEYTGAFAYVPAQLHEDVKVKLLRRKDLDFSELVEELLKKWLNEQV